MLLNGARRLLPEDVITHTFELLTYIEEKRDQWGMIQTQAVVNQRIEGLAKQYRRLPLLLATGDATEKVELERWGTALAAAVRSWKRRVVRPSSLKPEEVLEYLSRHLQLQLQNKWDELQAVYAPDEGESNSKQRRPVAMVLGVIMVAATIALPVAGTALGISGAPAGAVAGALAMAAFGQAGVSRRIINELRGALTPSDPDVTAK
jgi:hypothetical protein